MKRRVTWGVLGLVCILLIIIQPPLPPRIGEIDFRAYWGSSLLLSRGESFADLNRLFVVEREYTNWTEDYPMVAWSPPWLSVLLLPYAFVSFERAKWLWLLTNIALVQISTVLLWRDACASHSSCHRFIWIALVAVFTFSMTLVALIAGQVNTLVLLGLAGFLFFSKERREVLTGLSLALTLSKPQLVYLTFPILVLELVHARRWRALGGCVGWLLLLILAVFVLSPAWLSDYWQMFSLGLAVERETPTLSGMMLVFFSTTWAKWFPLVALPIMLLCWYRWRTHLNLRSWIDISLLVGIPTASFGWSYDQIMLCIPLLSLIAWMVQAQLEYRDSILLALILIIGNLVTFYQRILTPSEVYFFWVPILILVVYAYAMMRWSRRRLAYA